MKNRKLVSLISLVLLFSLFAGCGSSAKSEAAPAEAPMAAAAYDTATFASDGFYEPREEESYEMKGDSGSGIASAGSTNNSAARAESAGAMQSEKIIYSAYAQVETTEYEKTVDAVYDMVNRFGGFVQSSSISGSNYYRTSRGLKSLRSADFVLRIPAEHFSELTNTLSELGNVPYCNTSSENVTAKYYDTQSRMDAYKVQEQRLMEMLAIAESVEDMLAIQSQLTEVQYQIDSLQSKLTNYDRQVSYSTVNLTVSEVEEYTETPVITLTYGEKLAQRFKSSCENVGDFFVDGSLWFMGNLPEIALWCVGIFAAWKLVKKLAARRYNEPRKSRKERRAEKKAVKTESEVK